MVIVFLIEVIAALFLANRHVAAKVGIPDNIRPRIAVLVPAHNESTSLLPTLQDIKQQLWPGGRLLVVADNCTDDTAAVASAFGAEVVERHDVERRGKGYALDFGLQHLGSCPPEIVIMVDADCRLEADALYELARACVVIGRPVQALYLMTAPNEIGINHRVAEFAWRVKNWLRPLGLRAFGLPCQLMGAGMAFPWDVIGVADVANGCIVEDIKLGLELTSRGHPPIFWPAARVTSQFASSARAAETQRERWERGHINMILATVPRLFCVGVARRDWKLLALTLDLAVPPLSLLVFLVVGTFAIAALFELLGFASFPLILGTVTLMLLMLATFLAWMKCGRDLVPVGSVLSIVSYIAGKLRLHFIGLFRKKDAQWIKTDRAKSE